MSKVRISIMIGVGAAIAAAVWADATSDARKAIQAQYDKENAAAARKDVRTMLSIMSPDFVAVTGGQQVTAPQMQQSLTQMFKLASNISGVTYIDKVALHGKTAVVLVHDRSALTLTNPRNPNQKARLVVESRDQDTWVRTAKGWLETRSKELSRKRTVNGKPAPG